ncbi:DUF2891 domain-containing protein [Parapedobacter sp. ISTM3]|uniref:DUF2891 domain-containing protein n=1 Tax=Parapedobacter luteus TaxID=623280 RepID=A0A1T5FBD7_9SPHI|nr:MULTISPECIES: DUF2891 domain-containing protein [Parapedobacter]MBK1442469.1 DUF2891 domain-containing protein [Parapedobacter sp. ISTM3]SKB93471.1 Protein of unknown function [Parapedobacter luteus]
MRNTTLLFLLTCICHISFAQGPAHYLSDGDTIKLTPAGASHLAQLPLACMQQAYPYKTGVVFTDTTLIQEPMQYHPAFYGCFDWHSSVHGHWMLVRLLKLFPDLPEASSIRHKLAENLSATNIAKEVALFEGLNKSFERTYGWAWLLQLQTELLSWEDSLGKQLSRNLQPLANVLAQSYKEYLPKMNYAIRVGEHSNLAFGLRLAYDYAAEMGDAGLQDVIHQTAMRFYAKDKGCPLNWEPGGADFLSPCLEEADLMWRILPAAEYRKWLKDFLPQLSKKSFDLEPGTVSDRTDGKLVHLDGLNLSRAWCLYGIARHSGKNEQRLTALAKAHMEVALPHVASGDYMGEHWLASFAVYALTAQHNL